MNFILRNSVVQVKKIKFLFILIKIFKFNINFILKERNKDIFRNLKIFFNLFPLFLIISALILNEDIDHKHTLNCYKIVIN